METSVFKDILDHSISGGKIYGGTIDWLDSIKTGHLEVGTLGSGGTGFINGSEFDIGSFETINSLSATTINGETIVANLINASDNIIFNGGSQDIGSFYSSYVSTKSEVNYLVSQGHNLLVSQIISQLVNIGTTVISSAKWILLSTMQNVTSGAGVTFGSITGSSLNIGSYFTVNNSGGVGSSSLNSSGYINGFGFKIGGSVVLSSTKDLTVNTITGTGDTTINNGNVVINTTGCGLQIKSTSSTNTRIGTLYLYSTTFIPNDTITTSTQILLSVLDPSSPATTAYVTGIVTTGTKGFTININHPCYVTFLLIESLS